MVLHQGDQRRHHHRRSRQHLAGQLVAKTLASAGGKDRRHILAGKQPLNDRVLPFQELVEPEMLAQDRLGITRYRPMVRSCWEGLEIGAVKNPASSVQKYRTLSSGIWRR